MSDLGGGQVWEQKEFPHCRCYLVYLGEEGWVRIGMPDIAGNIAMTIATTNALLNGPIYTTEGMVLLLDRLNYTLVGQFAEILRDQYAALLAEPAETESLETGVPQKCDVCKQMSTHWRIELPSGGSPVILCPDCKSRNPAATFYPNGAAEPVEHRVSDVITPRSFSLGLCHDCGRAYGDEHGFPDLVLPNDVWAQISPTLDEHGLLCPSCIVARCHELGIECRARWRSGPFFEAESEPAK